MMYHRLAKFVLILAAVQLPAATRGYFTPNQGEAPREVLYTASAGGVQAAFAPAGVQFRIGTSWVSLNFGRAQAFRLEALDSPAALVNVFRGATQQTWHPGIPAYGGVAYRGVYPGIDAVYGVASGRFKCEFRVAAHADPGQIRLVYSGMQQLEIESGGGLAVTTGTGVLREARPEVYQLIAGVRRPVPASFRLLARDTAGFDIGDYDVTQPLIVDPLIWSTFFGRAGIDIATSVVTDSTGYIYMAGYTDSPDLTSTRIGPVRPVDAYVSKFQPDGRTLVYCTYLGGSGDDRAFGLAVDSGGNVVVTGTTTSVDFPTLNAYQTRLAGYSDAFIAKLDPSGALLFSTYFGGDGIESGNGIALDAAGNIYVAGATTSSSAFRTVASYQSRTPSGSDAFVVKLNPSGSAILYSAYLGGARDERARAIAVNAAGEAYITGETTSSDFPVANAFQSVSGGSQDAFVAKLNAAGTGLVFSTYLGGSGGATGLPESGAAIALDPGGSAYVTGVTSSTNFPVLNAFRPAYAGGALDAFISKFSPTGALAYSTYLGGSSIDSGAAIAVTPSGIAYVGGYTASDDLAGMGATHGSNHGFYDAFVTQVAQDGTILQTESIGGSENDAINAMTLVTGGQLIIAGQTASSDFPISNALQSQPGGAIDAFLGRITMTQSSGLLLVPVTPCRVVDTRSAPGPLAGPFLASGTSRDFPISSGVCPFSSTPLAYSLNVTVVPHRTLGYISVWPAGQPRAVVSTMNSTDGRVKANAVIVPAGANGAVSVFVTDDADVIIDVNGYFVAAGTPGGLAFYPVTPCRAMDTRWTAAPLGGPSLGSGVARLAPIQSSNCGLPSTAAAYSLNFTAVPKRTLSFLSTWPAGAQQPVVSTLNAFTGAVVANAAIIAAGAGGAIDLYASDAGDVIIDVNGYFAAPGEGGLMYYGLTPCRVVDTRWTAGALGGPALGGARSFAIGGSSTCSTPSTAAAYVLNATVVPHGSLGYLSLWPDGVAAPAVSTLNAFDGYVTSNAALVPANRGTIAAFTTNVADLILDLMGYFAP